MQIRRLIRRRLRTDAEGISAAGEIQAVISANVDEGRQQAKQSSHIVVSAGADSTRREGEPDEEEREGRLAPEG